MLRNDLKGIVKDRGFVLGSIHQFILSLLLILFASPLFRSLGFEYSGVVSLFSSLSILYYSAGKSISRRHDTVWKIPARLWLEVFILATIPLLTSLASVYAIPNCSINEGLVFYGEIVYPTAIIAMLCGLRYGRLSISRSRTRRNIYLSLFWLATLGLSLLPGYLSARIYTYGWQYGYFPGFVWDEAMELSSGYWVSRLIEIAIIISWILRDSVAHKGGDYSLNGKKHKGNRWSEFAFTVIMSCSLVLFVLTCIDAKLDQELSVIDKAENYAIVHYKAGSMTSDEILALNYDIRKNTADIRSIYKLTVLPKVDIYLFPTSEELYEYVGTREASISKPWKQSIYITKSNLRSLRHEMAHIYLSESGSFPFDISWSTGLTEGAAVAVEDDFDGIHSGEEMAARILQLKLSTGVQQIMQFSGFASNASLQSYTLAGSFSKYLLEFGGPEKFLRLYRDDDFEAVYKRSLSFLESAWEKRLSVLAAPLNHYDSLRTTFYFKRGAILNEPCLRRIGKLMKNADQAFSLKLYEKADSIYTLAMAESGRVRAIRGRVVSQLCLNRPEAALMILDTTASAWEINSLSALRILRGDVIALSTGDLPKATIEWNEAMKLQLGDNQFLASFMRVHFLGHSHEIAAVRAVLNDIYGIEKSTNIYNTIFALDPNAGGSSPVFYKARLYLYTSYLEKKGMLRDAFEIWQKGISDIITSSYLNSCKSDDTEELFDRLMTKKFSYFENIFTSSHIPTITTSP